jgi:hypothetical protein
MLSITTAIRWEVRRSVQPGRWVASCSYPMKVNIEDGSLDILHERIRETMHIMKEELNCELDMPWEMLVIGHSRRDRLDDRELDHDGLR